MIDADELRRLREGRGGGLVLDQSQANFRHAENAQGSPLRVPEEMVSAVVLSPDDAAVFRAAWEARYTGFENSHRIAWASDEDDPSVGVQAPSANG